MRFGLTGTERHHLFSLHGRSSPTADTAGSEQVPESLHRMLASLKSQPAYVIGRRWDVLAWNRAAVAVFGDYELLKGDECNVIYMLFPNPHHRKEGAKAHAF